MVQDPDRDGDLGVPPVLGPEPQAVAGDPLPAAENGFNQHAKVVLRGFLPDHAPMPGYVLEGHESIRNHGRLGSVGG